MDTVSSRSPASTWAPATRPKIWARRRNSAVADIDGIVEMLAGHPEAAERRLLAGYRVLKASGDRAFRPTTAAHLAQAVHAQGRDEEAMQFTKVSEELAADDALLTQIV